MPIPTGGVKYDFPRYNSLMRAIVAPEAGSYSYAGTGYANPHAVTQIANGVSTTTYSYDQNGNLCQKTTDGVTTTYMWVCEPPGVFEAFFDALATMSESAHLVQMFDSTAARAHVSAAGAKGGKTIRRSAVRVAASQPKSTSRSTSTACRSPSS